MAKSKKESESDVSMEIDIQKIVIEVCILGSTPLVMNRLSEKARRELLLPAPPKNKAGRTANLKHIPADEYRQSVYRFRDDSAPTRLLLPAGAFKRAMASAALDIPGATKAQMGRLTSIPMVDVPIYGIPQLFMATVRQADIKRTPDIRTRAILPRWACRLKIGFLSPVLKESGVIKLLAAAGVIIGVADWRSEKGAGNFGSFDVVAPDDPEFLDVIASGGRKAQDAALADPVTYDYETEDLIAWFDTELVRRDETASSTREKKVVAAVNGDNNEG